MTTDVLPVDAPVEAPPLDPPPMLGERNGRRPEGRVRRLWRGRPEDPSWVRPALLVLLTGTAAGQQIRVVAPSEARPEQGAVLQLRPLPERISWMDAASGAALEVHA